MSETETKTERLDEETAHSEANIIASLSKPRMEVGFKAAAEAAEEGSTLGRLKELFKDTAYYELGSQQLEQMKRDAPDLYYAHMSLQQAVGNLAGSLAPGYTKLEQRSAMTDGKRRQKASEVPQAEKDKAMKSARETAINLIFQIEETIKPEIGNVFGLDTGAIIATAKAIQQGVENGHALQSQPPNPDQVAALMQGVLASLNIDYKWGKQLEGEVQVDLDRAVEKQIRYDQAETEVKGTQT